MVSYPRVDRIMGPLMEALELLGFYPKGTTRCTCSLSYIAFLILLYLVILEGYYCWEFFLSFALVTRSYSFFFFSLIYFSFSSSNTRCYLLQFFVTLFHDLIFDKSDRVPQIS